MKKIISSVLLICVLLSTTYLSFAAGDYTSYRTEVDKINAMNIPIQPQRYHVVKSGNKYVSATSEGSGGICNVVAGTQLLNRRIAYDKNGNFASSDLFTLEEVMAANGVNIIEREVPYKHGNTGYVYTGATGSWYDKTYTKNGTTYKIAMKNSNGVKSDMKAKGISNFEDYLAQILINHPEGICWRTAGHYVVITDYEYNATTGKYTFYIIDGTNSIISGYKKGRLKLSDTSLYKDNGVKSVRDNIGLIAYINAPSKPVHTCSKYETYKNGSTKILGACKECHKKYDYSKIYNDGVAGLWIAKKSQNINLYNEPYEDASYTSVKSGELEVAGYVKNAYGNKWYVINGDKSKTYYVYENTFKNLYTQNSNYYENDYHKYDSGNIIENPSTSNNVNNNTSLGNSVVGTVDIPSSWDNLSIRSGPSTNYQIVGSMNDGVQCTVYPDKTSNGWYYVNYNGIWGYASGKQINISSSSVPSQPQTQTPTYTPTPASPSEPTPNAKKTIKVYFDSTGGSTEYAAQSVEEYGAITIPTKTPSKNGYDFLGWDTNPNAITPAYRSMQTINVGNTDMTLYAIWQRISTSWDEWDLSVSKDEVYFDNDDYKKTVIVKVDEQDNRDYYFTLEYDEYIDVEFGEEYYDEHGYFCREIIVYAPEEKLVHDEVIIRLRDGNDDIVDTIGFNVYLKENNGVQFADRNQTGITVYLNGEKLYFDVQPQIINGRTMVPMRKIFEELGTVVGWNNNTQTAIATTKDDIIRISIGGIYMSCNSEQKLLDSPAVVISGRTLVPVRAIAESLNCDVDWYDYGVNQVVDINMTRNINSIENKDGLVIGWSDFAPFSYIDENGSLVGFDTELAKYVCDFWGWDYSFIEIPFDMKFAAIEAGQIDCYWNGVTKTEERMENATFTNDYVEYTMQYEEDGEWHTSQECYAVPFKKGEYDLVELVNIALEEAQKDGTIEHLKWKYEIQ